MTRHLRSIALLALVMLVAMACGSGDGEIIVGEPEGNNAGQPIPVEPDGGIGDGAGPIPDADQPIPVEPDGGIGDGAPPPGPVAVPDGDWHGAELAETNCPGITWQRVAASVFTYSVPADFVDQAPQGVDSEIAVWSNDSMEVFSDYGWYSGSFDQVTQPDAERTTIDYSGFVGTHIVVPPSGGERGFAGVHFPQVQQAGGQWDLLTMVAYFDDPTDEITARCIVGSLDWIIEP